MNSINFLNSSHHPGLSKSREENASPIVPERTTLFDQIQLTKSDAENAPGAVGARWEGTGRKMHNRIGWVPVFAPPVTAQAVGAEEASSEEAERWEKLDNRETKRDVGEVKPDEFFLLNQKVDLEFVYKFMDYVNARQVLDKNGNLLAREIMVLCRRVLCRDGNTGIIKVVMTDFKDDLFDCKSRRFSGIMKFPTVPPASVRKHLSVELDRNIPRNYMGKGTFAYGKLIRYLFAAGLGLTKAPYIELDMSNAQTQLLYAHAKEQGFDFSQTVVFEQWRMNRDDVVIFLKGEMPLLENPGLVKTMVLSAQGQQSLDTVCKDLGIQQSQCVKACEWLQQMASDVRVICDFLRNVDDACKSAWPRCVEYAKENEKNPYAVFVRRLCNKGERIAIDLVSMPDENRIPEMRGFNNYQHDGLGVITKISQLTYVHHERSAQEKTGLVFKADVPPQTMPDLLTFARQRFQLPFSQKSSICDGESYLQKLTQIDSCFAMSPSGREHQLRVSSGTIGEIVASGLEDQIVCKESEEVHQRFDPKTGTRSILGEKGSSNIVRRELRSLFSKKSFLSWKDWKQEHCRVTLTQAPFDDAGWYGGILKKSVMNELGTLNKKSLDSDETIDKLLFRDGQVFNFVTQTASRVTIQDAMRRMCKVPLPEPLSSKAEGLLDELWDYATAFFAICNARRSNACLMEAGEADDDELTTARQLTRTAYDACLGCEELEFMCRL